MVIIGCVLVAAVLCYWLLRENEEQKQIRNKKLDADFTAAIEKMKERGIKFPTSEETYRLRQERLAYWRKRI